MSQAKPNQSETDCQWHFPLVDYSTSLYVRAISEIVKWVGSTQVGSEHLTGACVKGGLWVTPARWTDSWEIGEACTDSLPLV